ncbi:MAG: YciK family oxidoreductase [Gammaproteobacteria bacterium]
MNDSIDAALANFTPPDNYLANRVILITGASRGIGAALTKATARLGAQVVMLARTVRDMEKIADECLADGSIEPAIVPCNLESASIEDYQTVVDAINNEFGTLDGVVFNAGVLGELAPISSYDPVTWAKVFQVNLHSQFLLLQAALPLLTKSPDASVVFTTSSVGRKSRAYWGAYAASKFATEGLMQTLADEVDGTNLRVNAINPGRTKTRMRAQAYPAEDANTLPEPAMVLTPFLYLLGNQAKNCNGLSLDAQS